MATCLKDRRFLDFFFRRVQRNPFQTSKSQYPYVSFCGSECNYIKPDDTPIVFTELTDSNSTTPSLTYGASLTIPFSVEELSVADDTGRLYHPAPEAAGGLGASRCLLCSSIAEFISQGCCVRN